TSTGWANSFQAHAIAVDAAGNSYVAGQASDGLPTTPGAFQPTYPGNPNTQDGASFVVKFNPTGAALVYSTYLGETTGFYSPLGLALDRAGSAYVAGETNSTNFPTTTGAYATTVASGFSGSYV